MRRLITPHKSRVLVLALSSFLGGAVEAGFLVVITRTALAITDGDDSFGVLAGLYMSVGVAIAVAGALLISRLGLALLSVRASTDLTVQVTRVPAPTWLMPTSVPRGQPSRPSLPGGCNSS